ncbi:MAG: ELWxxDGT repeat protein [Planctomycetota bacterium]
MTTVDHPAGRSRKRRSSALTAVALLAGTVSGQALVRDLRTVSKPAPVPFYRQEPVNLTPFGGRVFFAAEIERFERAIWSTDGTAAGIELLQDGVRATEFAEMAGELFFSADGLWKTDGSPGGTELVKRTYTQPVSSPGPYWLTPVGSTLYFTGAIDAGTRLWKSDGTAVGTVEVTPGTIYSAPSELFAVDDRLFFTARTTAGEELWISDGTAAGTQLVLDIAPGSQSSAPTPLASLNGLLYFSANDGRNGVELWQSDGTASGTRLVIDLRPGGGSSNPRSAAVFQGRLIFYASGTLGAGVYITDGTASGTQFLAAANLSSSAEWNGELFFSSFDSIWTTDGTAPGTQLLWRTGSSASVDHLTVVGSQLFFAADTGGTRELWVSDGTFFGTRQVSAGVEQPSDLVDIGGIAVFTATDPQRVRTLWRSDGSAAGTIALPLPELDLVSSDPAPTASLDGVALVAADSDDSGRELWRSDGTVEGTRVIADIYPGPRDSSPDIAGRWRGFALFAATDGIWGSELWRTDGTEEGTYMLADLWSGPGSSDPREFVDLGDGRWLFAADADYCGSELFVTDGTAAGTRLLLDLNPGMFDAQPKGLTWFQDEVYFAASDGAAGVELFATDGSASGTRLVADLWPGSSSSVPQHLTVAGDSLYFAASSSSIGALWKTDGTAAGTISLTASSRFRAPTILGSVGSTLLFSAYDSALGYELWVSDGTAVGTVMLLELWPGPGSSQPELRAQLDDAVLFLAWHPDHGDELWTSDGTLAGTRVLLEIGPGPESGVRRRSRAARVGVGPHVLFGAGTGTGEELWVTDGTAAGTRPVGDLAPGGRSSEPGPFITAGDRVYFGALDSLLGRELFSVPLSVLGAAHVEALGRGCAAAGEPRLDASGLPVVANPGFALQLSTARPSAAAALLLAAAAAPGSCTLMLTAPVVALPAQTGASGAALIPLPVPPIPALRGSSLYAQGMIANPGGPLAGLVDVTHALRVVFGQ